MMARPQRRLVIALLAAGAFGAALSLPAQSQAQEGAQHATRGVIRVIAEDLRSARIAHEAIPNFMNAMTMTFTARDVTQLRGLAPGDRVTLRFTATPDGRLLIDAIARAPL